MEGTHRTTWQFHCVFLSRALSSLSYSRSTISDARLNSLEMSSSRHQDSAICFVRSSRMLSCFSVLRLKTSPGYRGTSWMIFRHSSCGDLAGEALRWSLPGAHTSEASRATKRDWLLGLLVGLLIITIVGFIPYFGGLVCLLVVCPGLLFAWQSRIQTLCAFHSVAN